MQWIKLYFSSVLLNFNSALADAYKKLLFSTERYVISINCQLKLNVSRRRLYKYCIFQAKKLKNLDINFTSQLVAMELGKEFLQKKIQSKRKGTRFIAIQASIASNSFKILTKMCQITLQVATLKGFHGSKSDSLILFSYCFFS